MKGEDEYEYRIELRGVYDGWSIGVKHDGTHVNRWAGIEGLEYRANAVDAYLRGEESKGRWY